MGVWAAAITVLVIFAIYWGYFVIFETLWSGQTPGKRIMRLRVVREDGRPVRFFEVFTRNLLRLTLDFQPFPTYAIGVISIIFSARSKRVGDFVAGTVVVKERATEAPTLAEIINISNIEQQRIERAAPAPFSADTRLLAENELRAVQTFLKRRYELTRSTARRLPSDWLNQSRPNSESLWGSFHPKLCSKRSNDNTAHNRATSINTGYARGFIFFLRLLFCRRSKIPS